jgi:hypothetical protein
MKPAWSSLRISSRMKFCRSIDCLRGFCRTGLASGRIFRWCSITSLGIPGICDGSQANTSTFARRKAMSALSYFSPRFPPTRVVWEASAPTWMVFTGTLSVSDGQTLGALAMALARKDEGSDPSAMAAGARLLASTWSFSSTTTAAARSPWMVRTPVGEGIFRTRYP